jgi:hypothetical protein
VPHDYNEKIRAIEMPDRIKALPVSSAGFPVPWFVSWESGEPDFRVIKRNALRDAVYRGRCWICGGPLGRTFAMTIGPMCAINRTISEPPSHRDCAVFSAIACPFLSNPRMRRNAVDLPEERVLPPGEGIARNPGACAVWITRSFQPFKARGGVLFNLGEPLEVLWFAEGRAATRDEVMASIRSGLPLLEAAAALEGPDALADLAAMTDDAMRLLPPEAPP